MPVAILCDQVLLLMCVCVLKLFLCSNAYYVYLSWPLNADFCVQQTQKPVFGLCSATICVQQTRVQLVFTCSACVRLCSARTLQRFRFADVSGVSLCSANACSRVRLPAKTGTIGHLASNLPYPTNLFRDGVAKHSVLRFRV